jgi:PQQ-dependent catabolism-associated beta-propeller protein
MRLEFLLLDRPKNGPKLHWKEALNGGTSMRTLQSGGILMALVLAAWLVISPAANAYTVYVTNEKDNTVSIIDSAKLEVVKTVKIGQRPRGIALSKDHRWLLICASDDNTVQVYDTQTMKFVKSLPSGQDPELFILHPDGNPLYIANEEDNLVTVVDIERDAVLGEIPVGVEPEGMGISPDGKLLVTTSETTNMAHFIETATNKIVDNVLVDSRPRFAEFTADGTHVWVSSEIGGTVAVIETKTRKIATKIAFKIPGVLCCARTRQSDRCDRHDDVQGREISVGRPARLAARLHARRKIAVHHQRCLQRCVGYRRGETARGALHQGRALPLGCRRGAILIQPGGE